LLGSERRRKPLSTDGRVSRPNPNRFELPDAPFNGSVEWITWTSGLRGLGHDQALLSDTSLNGGAAGVCLPCEKGEFRL
jgi:hypothetical protein